MIKSIIFPISDLVTSENEQKKTNYVQNDLQNSSLLICVVLCMCSSFYQRKYAVFLRLFAHQREYQVLMNQRWCSLWQRAMLTLACCRVTNQYTHWKTRTVAISRCCPDIITNTTEWTSWFFIYMFSVTWGLMYPDRTFLRRTCLLHFNYKIDGYSEMEVMWNRQIPERHFSLSHNK